MQKVVEKIEARIQKNVDKCKNNESSINDKAVVAYVMLRSMEGKERAINAYKVGSCRRWCLTNLCCQGGRFKSKMFMGKWLRVKEAKAPDIIKWENLRSSRSERCFRALGTSLLSLLLIAGTFVLLLVAQYYQKEMQSYSPQIECPEGQVVTQ